MKKSRGTTVNFGKVRYLPLLLALPLQMPGTAMAVNSMNTIWQEQVQVTGVVVNAHDQTPIQGATLHVNQQTVGTTDGAGKFSISVPVGSELRISSVGFTTERIAITQQRNNLVVSLKATSADIDEVVVTALGIQREARQLGYAVSTIKGDELREAMPTNWSDALKGKVAGLNLTQAGSGPLNSTRINLRGDRSFSPNNNEALIVIDGIPMINSSGKASSGVNDAYGAGVTGNIDKDIPIDFGNGLSDLNPDDIASVTVLKGPAAAALYGSRAGNGALIITTKKGLKRDGIGISLNSNTAINDILRWPDIQYQYGQGNNNRNANGELYYSYGLSEDGVNTGSTSSAWGPKFNGQMYYQYDPATEEQSTERLPWQPYKNNIRDLFQTGSTFTNSVSLDGATDKFSARASLTHTKNNWILQNSGFERLVASMNTSAQISEKLKINAKFSYASKNSDNLPGTGYNNQSISYFMIFQNPNVDLNAVYGPRWKRGQEQLKQIHPYSSYIENPFIIMHEMTNGINSMNMDGNLQGVYTFNPKWELMVRSGINLRQDKRESRRPFDTANFPRGYYKQQDVYFFESNTDALLSFNESWDDRFSLRASLGGNVRKYNSKENNAVARALNLPGIYKLSNSLEAPVANNTIEEKNVNSVYGLVNLGWDDKVYVDITGRNDWSSTLPSSNRSYFYPSVSSSYILSDIFELPSTISFAKARLSWAMVGNDTEPYRLHKYYQISPFPGSSTSPSTLHNTNLKPEISTSWEAGIDFSLFNSRLNADVNYYNNVTVNQVLRVPLDITTGYSSAFINGGKVRNRGIEVLLSGRPIVNDNFSWTTTATWAKNKNRILELSKDLNTEEQVIATSGAGAVSIIAREGGTTGDLYGYALVRNEQGQVIFDANTGLAIRPTEMEKIGNAYADWRAGFNNEFQYKNWTLGVLLDGQYGGIVYSQTHHKMTEQGKLGHTLRGRETMTIVGDGVIQNSDGTYSPNTKEVAIQTWYGDYYRRANAETNSFDASYLKLREVRLEYRLPQSFSKRLRVSNINVAVFGRDLAMISKFPIFDPETAALNGDTIMPGMEMGQMPTPRTWGFNLQLSL